jgi:hypothetical protein
MDSSVRHICNLLWFRPPWSSPQPAAGRRKVSDGASAHLDERFTEGLARALGPDDAYSDYRGRLGRALLLGLEVLVAADIIRTVALQPTLGNVVVLGLLVAVPTFLSWSLVVEIEGQWPWSRPSAERTSRGA